ncbi:class F sortase [Alkalicoccobacillus plakortidis]|uniref:Class F sortase n=1 Tax=Alkalicoccobacillus plakortidis TaxID=444060 RepID=A0ABT0XJK5_9BACI|nr:class F sortase [Alkalicoccobacillus plakortidis]MCM2675404.1 class F sortase [Alkalicoccobacillus plakortidis]
MKWLSTFLTIGVLLIGLVAFSTASTPVANQSAHVPTVAHKENSAESEVDDSTQEDKDEAEVEQALAIPGEGDSEFTFVDTAVLHEVEAIQSQISEQQDQKNKGIKPVEIRIPSLGVEANIEDVGVLDNGQMGVPEDVDGVGWFEPGTNPGAIGNSVMAGHVDSRTGPAVFFELEDLVEGDEIIVMDDEGKELTFEVKSKESYDRNDAPINDIFGATDTRSLNLITCSGTFNREVGTHDERLVVYTELVEEDEPLDVEKPQTPDNVKVQGAFLTWHAVRDDLVVGYRIYKEIETDEFEHVESLSAHERKSYTIPEDSRDLTYYVTTVDLYGQESEPSELVNTD